jgi:tRNA threonylcarbamoyladenosine biosynthesis protein TsaE
MKLFSRSEKETIKIAQKWAKTLRGGEVILLFGDLGSGKTTFVKGLAQALGVRQRITSPTFVLLKVYHLNKGHKIKTFVHLDAYRVQSGKEFLDIGLSDWLGKKRVVVVGEWGEKIKSLLKGIPFWQIEFKVRKNENERLIVFRKIVKPNKKARY